MAETFEKAMEHALGCIGKAGLTLEEQMKAVRHIFNGEDTFVWQEISICRLRLISLWGVYKARISKA
jgi:hypothetical protein